MHAKHQIYQYKIGEITEKSMDGLYNIKEYATYIHDKSDLYCTKHIPPIEILYRNVIARYHNYDYNIGDKVVFIVDNTICDCNKILPIIQYKLEGPHPNQNL